VAAPRIDPKDMRPSRIFYWVAGLLAVLSVLFAGVLFFSILRPLFDPIENFEAGTPEVVSVDAGDWRTIYARSSGTFDAPRGDTYSPNDFACTVVGPDGKRVQVSRADGFTYQRNDDTYEAKLQFKAKKSGDQVVRCAFKPDPGRPVALAVGPHFGTVGFVTRLVLFFAALFGGPLAGGILALLVFLLRQRSKSRLQAQERASWPPPGAGG
jgi:hypothetical protein